MSTRADKLARLRAARSGKLVNSDDEENINIYDEVDEHQYRKHKRDRVLHDDFIVDDQGEGYAETGADEWEDQPVAYHSDEEVERERDPKTLKKVKMFKDSTPKGKAIDTFFSTKQTVSLDQKLKNKKKDSTPGILNDILSDFTNMATANMKKKPEKPVKRKDPFSSLRTSTPTTKKVLSPGNSNKSFENTSPVSKRQKVTANDTTAFFTAHQFGDSTFETPSSPIKNNGSSTLNILDELDDVSVDVSNTEAERSSTAVEKDELDDSDDEDLIVSRRKRTIVNVDRSINLNSLKPIKPIDSSPIKDTKSEVLVSSPSKAANTSGISNITFEKIDAQDAIMKDDDGDSEIQMFWMDYIELESSLLLFGKIKTPENKVVSGMVQVNGINRELYFLPRKFDENEPNDTVIEPSKKDEEKSTDEDDSSKRRNPNEIHEEIIPLLMDKFGLDLIKAKSQSMKYAFEHYQIPKKANYLKVLLPYNTPKSQGIQLPPNLSGETFEAVFGTGTSIFESFVRQRRIMGPCWLTINGNEITNLHNVSHCNIEISVNSPNDITPNPFMKDPPPSLNVLSINVQPYLNPKTSRQEVGSVSLALYKDLPQDVPLSSDLEPTEEMTLARPVGGSTTLPVGLTKLAEKKGIPLRGLTNEKALLNCLVGLVKKYDPDVFVGHRLEGVTLDILLHRMKDLNIQQWSNMGRRAKKQFNEKFNRSNGRYNSFIIREMLAGRLLCDISNDMGQSLTPKCQNWELSEMHEVVCREKYAPMEVNLANPLVGEDANKLLTSLSENRKAVRIIAKTAFGMQILSISKQLTNLAGNAWSHTLGGTRAGRNEYILLHEFEREGYLVPDRETRAQKIQQAKEAEEANEDNDEGNTVSNKKAKFQGGLVFEPEKGLHKNYILVMDFNSLYPSIIQEYNICFTTIERSKLQNDELPKLPKQNEIGVLPKLLQQLVSRRRDVKNLMKDPKLSPIERAQLDIKQLALKVTANSMYGCLGYVNSRFYAKPLAMLVTNKGREILMDTRQLAESLGLTVVYGDTDSVMIDTRCDNYKDAIKIGDGFKAKVNERYRLLEIDIDNVFKRLLLHSKKKYAALNTTLDKNGDEVSVLEVKGLDMKRREYCPLSKELSEYVLNEILESSDPQEALNAIYSKLEEVKNEFKENKIPMHKLRINTKLSKDPTKYPGGKSMPSVQVALRLQKEGKIIKAGSVITFVITSGEPGEDESTDYNASSVASRARALVEVVNSEYKPDIKYYSEKQLFNPIDRLLTRVEGYDIVKLADSLGLESNKFEAKARDIVKQNELQPLESTIPDSERFRDMKDFNLKCHKCNEQFTFGGIQSSDKYMVTFHGIKCRKCETIFPTLSISSQVELFIRKELDEYYKCWLTCSDCGLQTREVSVYGKRCIGSNGTAHECKGVMSIKYNNKMIYNQLMYLQSLFDVEKAKKQQIKPLLLPEDFKGYNQGEIEALAEQNRGQFKIYSNVVKKYLDVNGRRFVDLGSIFRSN